MGSAEFRPRQSRGGRLQTGGEGAEQGGVQTGGGIGEAHMAGRLDDAGGELGQVGAKGRELGPCQRMRLWHGVAQAEREPVGGGVQHETDLRGERDAAGGVVSRPACSAINQPVLREIPDSNPSMNALADALTSRRPNTGASRLFSTEKSLSHWSAEPDHNATDIPIPPPARERNQSRTPIRNCSTKRRGQI